MRRLFLLFVLLLAGQHGKSQELYEFPLEEVNTRWSSFENPLARKGAGGMENLGAKGHAFDGIKAGESVDLVKIGGSGVINRIWLTLSDRSPEMLRSLRIEMYWDGQEKPAVSVPLGDFFGVGLGIRVPFESALFSDPEGRSFNCSIPMPYKKGARISVINDAEKDLNAIFYDVNFLSREFQEDRDLYFHAFWGRNLRTTLKKDFPILPKVQGKGRFLGTNIGILTHPTYQDTWWGEGEVKIYLDGDSEFPSLVGSGTEDYVGTAYGQGTYDHRYQGSLVADPEEGAFAFYRYHIKDPVYFHQDIEVRIQQIGGAPTGKVRELVANGAELIPISVDNAETFFRLLEMEDVPGINDPGFPKGWTNFYRRDDVSATAYFYLDKPVTALPDLQRVHLRTQTLKRGAE